MTDLATITAAHALCGFDLSDAQEDLVVRHRQAVVDDGAITDGEAGAIEASVTASMKLQVPEGACKANGPGHRFYRALLQGLGSSR